MDNDDQSGRGVDDEVAETGVVETTGDEVDRNSAEVEQVLAIAEGDVRRLCDKEALAPDETARIWSLFRGSILANSKRFPGCINDPCVAALPESRTLLREMSALLISGDSYVGGMDHVQSAVDFMADGGNVLLVSNHTSGADTLVLEHSIQKALGANVTDDWYYMAGHVVNQNLLPLSVSSGVNRIQIFSVKYVTEGDEAQAKLMSARNHQAIQAMVGKVMDGGRCIVLYPEGGRGENGVMKLGEPRTMKIPELMSMFSPKGLMILPSHVEATDILLVVRGPNEFQEGISHIRRGRSSLNFGQPQMWNDLQPSEGELADFITQNSSYAGASVSNATKGFLIKRTMGLIAAAVPNLE